MKVGKVVIRTGRTVQRNKVRLQLDQIAGDKARRQPKVAQDLHKQPTGVTARPCSNFQRLLCRLNTRFHPDDIAYFIGQTAVQRHQKVNDLHRVARDCRHQVRKPRPHRLWRHIDRQIAGNVRTVVKRKLVCRFLNKEVKRVVDPQVGDQIHLDLELAHRFREHKSRQPVPIGVLLVVDEMSAGRHR